MSGLEILGGVAAGLQLADVALQSSLAVVKFFLKAKNAPQEIRNTATDIENICSVIKVISSTLVHTPKDTVTPAELSNLTDQIKIIEMLSSNLEAKLKSLELRITDSHVRKALKLISTMRKKDELKALTKRISSVQVLFSSLLGARSISAIGRLADRNTHDHHTIAQAISASTQASNGNFSSLASQLSAAQNTSENNYHAIEQKLHEYSLTTTSGIDSIKSTLISAQDDILMCVNQTASSVNTEMELVRTTAAQTRTETVNIRSNVTNILESMQDIKQKFHQLTHTPSLLAEEWRLSSDYASFKLNRKWQNKPRRCVCRQEISQHTWRKGSLQLKTLHSTNHSRNCPLFPLSDKTSSTELYIPLVPFLSLAIGFTFSATSGAGGFSLSPTLIYYPIVRSSDSPAFTLLNDLYHKCKKALLAILFSLRRKRITPRDHYPDIARYLTTLAEMIHHNPILVRQRNEYGNTLLTAMISSIFPCKYNEFNNIVIKDIFDGDYNLQASFDRTIQVITHYGGHRSDGGSTALENTLRSVHFSCLRSDILDYFRPDVVLFRHGCVLTNGVELNALYLGWRDIYLTIPLLMLGQPYEYEEVTGFGPLQIAVLQKSEPDVKNLLANGHPPDGESLTSLVNTGKPDKEGIPSTPLECAVGWSTGMQLLLRAGANGFYALARAVYQLDIDSINILLESDCPLFLPLFDRMKSLVGIDQIGSKPLSKEEDFYNDFIYILSERFSDLWSTEDPRVATCISHAVANRRLRLRQLGTALLSDSEQQALEIHRDQLPDANALQIYQTLIQNDIQVPSALWPGTSKSVYHMNGLSFVQIKAFYSAGFRDLNILATMGDVVWPWWKWGDSFATRMEVINWLAARGARMPTMEWSFMHEIAINLSLHELEEIRNSLCTTGYAETIGAMDTDGCECFCSENGCLPIHILLNIRYHLYSYGDMIGRRQAVEMWCNTFQLSSKSREKCYEEASRAEIFERLGMAHTCWRKNGPHHCIPFDEEASELRSEDALLHEQLELIMQAYLQKRQAFVGKFHDFWDQWWIDIDRILPETHRTADPYHGLWDERNWKIHKDEKAKRLVYQPREQANPLPPEYEDMDFISIIRLELFPPKVDEDPNSATALPETLDFGNAATTSSTGTRKRSATF